MEFYMNLLDILPEASIRQKFTNDIDIKVRDRKKIAEIANLKSSCMVEIGSGAWDRYVRKYPNVDKLALAQYFTEQSPKLYLGMERYTGLKVLKDILYVTVDIVDEKIENPQCAELLLALIWPNVLRISDVTFVDPYEPIPKSERRYHFQYYKGLGLFQELLRNCENYCRKKGILEITLSAAHEDLVPFFESHGFHVEDTPLGLASLESGVGIPMHKLL